jgi:hypothetical protein
MSTDLALQESGRPQYELATAGATSEKEHEIQAAIIIARKFPRNEDGCFQRLMRACSRSSFAGDARYSFPRGGQDVTGPSVNLAREAARIWGNVRFGLYIVREDETHILIRGWAWDVETNTKVEHDDNFKKLVYRKQGGWVVPDERDLRELVNRRGAILVRNSLLQVMPKDLIEDALFQCEKSLEESASSNPDGERKRVLVDFSKFGVLVEDLEAKLGHPFSQATARELAELRSIHKAIADGQAKWADYVGKDEKPAQSSLKDKLKKTVEQDGTSQQRETVGAPTQQARDAAPPFNPEVCPPADPAPRLTAGNVCRQLLLCEEVTEWSNLRNAWEQEKHLHSEADRKQVLAAFDQAKKRMGKK